MSSERAAARRSAATPAACAADRSRLLPCRSCYSPTLASQLRPYRYLSPHAFESDFGHRHSVCAECDCWLHPGEGRSDLWELADGKDKFCRLCGDGDRSITAVVCDEDGCTFAFCILCIRANGGERLLREVSRDGRWVCFNHKSRPAGCEALLLHTVDLACRAERGQFSHRNVFDCFNAVTHSPIPSFTYLTPKAKQRWQPHGSPQPPLRSAAPLPKRVVSTCLYKWTSSAPKHHVKYLYGLMENLQHFPARWPGWTLRLYYDNSLILPAAAPQDELDHMHSQSDEPPPADAADNSQYTQSLAHSFRLLLSTFASHPSVELVWFNFPYLQDRSHHHHGHVGMAARFLALADLGVSATHVVVADLDNLWHETARLQAETFEAGKRYHRYHDIDYVFPLAGGSFNARVERIQPDEPDASPFADIESHLHAFFTAHFRAPEELRDKYGHKVDESESVAPVTQALSAGKRSRAGITQPSDSSEQRRKSQRVAIRSATAPQLSRALDCDRVSHRPTMLSVRQLSVSSTSESSEEEERADSVDDDEERDGDSRLTDGRRSSKRICAAAKRRRQSEERARRIQRQQQQHETRTERQHPRGSVNPLVTCPSSGGPHDSKERRDLHHYFFGYSFDQVFLLERVWPIFQQSCSTTVVKLEHIKPDTRDRNRQEEAAVAEADSAPQLSRRCGEDEYSRRQLVRLRAMQRSRWQSQRQKRLLKHYLGQVDERYFPQHHNVRDWLSKRVREVWSHWRRQTTATTASIGHRRAGTWRPRVDLPPTLDIHSLVTAPGHFSAADAAEVARHTGHFAPSAAAAYIGPPSATSPIDCAERWNATPSSHNSRVQQQPGRPDQQPHDQQSAHSRQLSFSRADAASAAPTAAAANAVIDVSCAASADESHTLRSMAPVCCDRY